MGDVERLAVKLALDRAAPRDLVALRRSLAALPRIADVLARCPEPGAREALGVAAGEPWVDTCADLHDLLARAVADEPPARASDGGVVRDGFDATLDEAREWMRGGQRLIVELEARLRESSGIASLKLRYTRVFGWYIEVTRAHVDKAPAAWRRKQTVATGERFTCDDLDALADKLAHAEERAASREAELFARLVRDLAVAQERLRAVAARLASWDVASALAEVAHRDDWVRPEIDDSLELVLEDARHPVVEKLAAAGRYVPNDVSLGAADGRPRLWLVTGPNMAGKSTLMRQTALCVILAQMGAFVPARRALVGVVDRVLTRVGASDNLSRGESTFMVEMKETAHVLRSATQRSLVVLDEIGRGHEHLRRPGDRVGRGRAPARHDRVPRDVRDALPRAHRASPPCAAARPRTGASAPASTRATSSFCTSSSAGRRRAATASPARGSPGYPRPCSRGRAPCSGSWNVARRCRAALRPRCGRGRAQVAASSICSTDPAARRHPRRIRPSRRCARSTSTASRRSKRCSWSRA